MFSLTVFVSSAMLHRGRWSFSESMSASGWTGCQECQENTYITSSTLRVGLRLPPMLHHVSYAMWQLASLTLLCCTQQLHLCYLISHTVLFKFKCVEFSNHLHSLTFCSLGESEISDEGVCRLAEALQVNQSLQELK